MHSRLLARLQSNSENLTIDAVADRSPAGMLKLALASLVYATVALPASTAQPVAHEAQLLKVSDLPR